MKPFRELLLRPGSYALIIGQHAPEERPRMLGYVLFKVGKADKQHIALSVRFLWTAKRMRAVPWYSSQFKSLPAGLTYQACTIAGSLLDLLHLGALAGRETLAKLTATCSALNSAAFYYAHGYEIVAVQDTVQLNTVTNMSLACTYYSMHFMRRGLRDRPCKQSSF